MSTIVVGVDGSDCARTALRFAAGEAPLRGSRLRAVRVVEVPAAAWPGFAGVVGLALERAGSELRADVEAEAAGVEVAYEVLGGHPAEELVKAAEGADLVVVGSRGLGGFHGLLVGSVSQQCLQHATCPVAVVRTLPDPPRGRILVGVDGSPPSAQAFQWAADEAGRRGATLGVVHAWLAPTWLAAAGPIAPVPAPVDFEAAREAAGEVVARLVAQAPPEVRVEPAVEPGTPAAVLVDESKRADLLVVGSRGHGGFAGLLLGSVSQQCAHHAACPVVVVHRER